MSAQDATLAERSRRHRAQVAHRQEEVLEAIGAMRQDVQALTSAVMALAGALRNGVDNAVDTSVAAVDKPSAKPSRRGRSVAQREGARARTGDGPPAPTGPRGSTSESMREDAWRVLQVLVRPASAGAVVDALSIGPTTWSMSRVAAALVYLQDHGQVRRVPGEGTAPDRWHPTPDPTLEVAPPPVHEVVPAPEVHVTCRDYLAHRTAHRWDAALGQFTCDTCAVSTATPLARPPGARGVTPPRQATHAQVTT